MQDADFLFKPFEQTHFRIVALEDAFGRELLDQDFAEKVFIAFAGLAERLDYEVISVDIDDDGGQQVGFAVDQAIRVGIFDDGFAIGCGVADAFGEKGAVDGNVFAREQADGDLRFVTVKRASVIAPALVGDADDGAGFCRRAANVAAIDPGMAGAQALDTSSSDDDRIFSHNSCLGR